MKLRNGTELRIYETWVETDLPDGRTIYAVPREDQIEIASELGYEGDVVALTLDHDPLHSLLCDWLGLPYSYALAEPGTELAGLEEEAVLAVQKFARKAGVIPIHARVSAVARSSQSPQNA